MLFDSVVMIFRRDPDNNTPRIGTDTEAIPPRQSDSSG